jgi:tetratricopeptide (TPR) repeat protein
VGCGLCALFVTSLHIVIANKTKYVIQIANKLEKNMRQANPPDILLIEDHHEAYYAWRERRFKKMTLVHLDAHIDFGFQEVKEFPLILNEAKSISELKSQLEKAVLFRRKKFELEKLTHIGNYIYPAMRDGIVAEFYWVIPGDIGEFRKCLGILKSLLRDLKKEDPCPADAPPLIQPGIIKTRLYGRPFHITTLDTLPRLKRSVLLDIDTDFLIIDSLRRADAVMQIARREPWIGPDELAVILRKKISRPRCTTIAYSVNGGFTPMVYKTQGDRLAEGLGYRDEALADRLTAGDCFESFREAFDRKDFSVAGQHFREALRLNPAYRASDNNFGPLYFQVENYRRAEKEWQGMLQVDGCDVSALAGLGKIRLARGKYREAKDYFAAALQSNANHKETLIGLAETEFHLKNYREAETLIEDYERLDSMQGYSWFLSGKILEKTKRPQAALAKYKEAMQLGMDHVEILIRLVRLSKRYDRTNLDNLKRRCRDVRKTFARFQKKALMKEGKINEMKRIDEKLNRLFSCFNRSRPAGNKTGMVSSPP